MKNTNTSINFSISPHTGNNQTIMRFQTQINEQTEMKNINNNHNKNIIIKKWKRDRILGGTGQRQNGDFLQKRVPDNVPFPCRTKGQRSKTIPTSVHQLRPGNFYHFQCFFFSFFHIFILFSLFVINSIQIKAHTRVFTARSLYPILGVWACVRKKIYQNKIIENMAKNRREISMGFVVI